MILNTGRMKYYNLFGNGSLGRVEANWDSIWVEDPRSQNPGYWSYSRTDSRYYYIKDHLGSIRITIDEAGNVVNAQDYYSYGSILRSYTGGGFSGERYKFTGKERDTETNYDYFGASYYDSELGRFLTTDPLADKYPGWSPYNYCFDNPLKLVDPDGNGPELAAAAYAALEAAGLTLLSTAAALDAIGYNNTAEGIKSMGNILTGAAEGVVDFISSDSPNLTPFPITQGEGINKTTTAPADNTIVPNTLNAKNSSPNEKHGDSGREISKKQKQVEELKKSLDGATKKEAKKIKQKIKNIRENAQKKKSGEEHSRRVKK